MRAQLKSICAWEIREPLEDFEPKDPEHFGFSIQAFIGSDDSETSDSFDAVVCTPSWLGEHFDDKRFGRWDFEPPGLFFGNRLILMKRWDYSALQSAPTGLCGFHAAKDWGTLANRIGRFVPWEFDYKYDEEIDARG